ncbi:MAG: geranylgeranyl reductase family protein [Candidatus Micrarchaeia archaeon]
MLKSNKNIIIVGAGAIGLYLAKQLGELGLSPLVYDSKSSVSDGADKASGILSIDGLASAGIFYNKYKSSILNALNGAKIRAKGATLNIEADEDKAYIIDRAKFAALLAHDAQKAGAELILKTKLDRYELIKMRSDNNIIIGTDGAISTVANAFNFPPIEKFILTYKAEYKNVDVKDAKKVELFFSNKITKGFFGWIAPHSSSTVEIGVGVSSKAKINSLSVFSKFVNQKEIAEKIENAELIKSAASIIPIQLRKKTAMRNVILIGDSAGQVKASTGGGIIFGMLCAKIAAETISKYVNEDIESLYEYEKIWRKNYSIDFAAHNFIHSYYSNVNDMFLSATMRIGKLFGIERFLAKHGNMDRPSSMLKFNI